MSPANRLLFAHLSWAVARYIPEAQREARANGSTAPVELLAVAEFLADCARARQDATPLEVSSGAVEAGAMTDGLLLTKRQAAAELAVSVRQLERLIADPGVSLSTVRAGGAVRIRRSDLEQYVADLATRPGGTFRDDLTTKEQSA